MGIPLPASTQWELVERRADGLLPVFDALVPLAAQGEVVHNDDTSMTVLELGERTREEALAAGESEKMAGRTGVRTTGVVSVVKELKVALYFTGRQLGVEPSADGNPGAGRCAVGGRLVDDEALAGELGGHWLHQRPQ